MDQFGQFSDGDFEWPTSGLIGVPEGTEIRLVIRSYNSTTVAADGTVTHVHIDEDGRSEMTEHISESPVRDALPGWVWDLTLDPRLQA